MIEPEIAFADLNDDMDLARDMMKYVIRYVMDTCPQDLQFFNQFVDKGLIDRLTHIVESDFAHVTYTGSGGDPEKANSQFEYQVDWGVDLQTEHEKYLTEQVFQKPVFVMDYPKEIKSFYMRMNDDGRTVAAMDMLVPGIRGDHRRQPAWGAPGSADRADEGAGPQGSGLLVVFGSAPLRNQQARGIWPGL